MNITLSPVFSSSPSILEGSLRRQLLSEMNEIADVIEKSKFYDEMTQEISSWQQKFAAALKTSCNEEEIRSEFIPLLQRLLTDPITRAPLDEYAVFASDGQTYSQMSLAVYQLTFPKEYHSRSPLNVNYPIRFATIPHPVVRHMIEWLKRHDAYLYTGETVRTYLRLLPRQPEEREKRVEDIFKRTSTERTRENTELSEFEKELDQQLQSRMNALSLELEQSVDRLWSKWEKDPIGENREAEFTARDKQIRQRLSSIIQEQEEELSEMDDKLEEACSISSVNSAYEGISKAERASIESLKTRAKEYLNQGFAPLAQRIRTHAEENEARLQEIEDEDKKSLHEVEQILKKQESDIKDLKKKVIEDEKLLKAAAEQLSQAKKDKIALDHAVLQAKIAVADMERRRTRGLLITAGIIAGCAFANWGIAAYLESIGSSISITLQPTTGAGAVI